MTVPDWIPINWNLIKHPLNWAVVFLMVTIAAFALHLLLPQDFSQGVSSSNAQ